MATKKPIYELYFTKGVWKWRKRFKNGKIPNHQYNSKAGAIKGMQADWKMTKNLTNFDFKEIK